LVLSASLHASSPGTKGRSVDTIGRSSVLRPPVPTGRRVAAGVPVYRFDRVPGVPPVGVARARGGRLTPEGFVRPHPHAPALVVLVLVERGGGSLRVDGREWVLDIGDVLVVAPGEVVVPDEAGGLQAADACAVFFPPDVIEAHSPGAFLSWRAHPLLFPF